MSDDKGFIPELDSIISQSEKEQKKKTVMRNTEGWLGKNFQQYQVIKKLGEGAMAEVFKIYHPGLERNFALKLTGSSMEKVGTISDQDAQRFQREAQVSFDLKHPNIVRVVDIGNKEGRAYLIMDYVEGTTLQEFMEEKKPSINDCLKILLKIGRALHYAHQQGIIHRDLKPGNIMICHDKQKQIQPMLMDFGLAKPVDVDSSFTQTGTVLGTPSYMAPEQAKGLIDEINATSDVYGLGAILYNMITGKAPFERKAVMATLMAVVREEVIPPSEYAKDLNPEVEKICLKALQKNAKNRYQSVEEMCIVIEKYLNPKKAADEEINRATLIQETEPAPQKQTTPTTAKSENAFSKYVVKKELAKGGMGVVYLAQDPKLQRVVAIKILHSQKHASDKEKQRFLQEARMAAKLSHGGIITVYEVGECDKGYFIAMEYFPAKDLQQLLGERKKFFQSDIKYTSKVIIKILEAIDHAHKNKVLHRDLKPANILVKGEELKITDFGLAAEINKDLKPKMFMGTPVYCSPEQIQSHPLNHQADLYSIGIIFYEMLTGQVPFKAKDFPALSKKIVQSIPSPPSRLNRQIPNDLENIILKAIDKKKENRYHDAEDFRIDIQRFLLGKPVYAKSPSTGTQINRYFQQNKTLILSMIAAFVLVLSIYFTFSTSAEEKKRMEHVQNQKETISSYLETAENLLKENKLFDALKSAQSAENILQNDEMMKQEIEYNYYTTETKELIDKIAQLKDRRLQNKLSEIKNFEQQNDWKNIAIAIIELKSIAPEHPEVLRIEKLLKSDRVEIIFNIDVKKASFHIYEITESKYINFAKTLYHGEVSNTIQVTQGKWYLIEMESPDYFTIRTCFFAHPQSKTALLNIQMVSKKDYEKFADMVYIPQAENTTLGPKQPFPRKKVTRFPLESNPMTIPHFLIDRYEVTNIQYQKFLLATNKNKKEYWPSYWEDGKIPEGFENNPVTDVQHKHASEYAEYYDKEIPTSEQLELAALSTDGRRFPWGDLSALANEEGAYSYQSEMMHMTSHKNKKLTGHKANIPIGSKKNDQSPYGVMDLAGNVREWTQTSKTIKVRGKGEETFYVVRGGGAYVSQYCYESDQYPLWAFRGTDPSIYTGFRCVKNLNK